MGRHHLAVGGHQQDIVEGQSVRKIFGQHNVSTLPARPGLLFSSPRTKELSEGAPVPGGEELHTIVAEGRWRTREACRLDDIFN
jgi:hypothetical protein